MCAVILLVSVTLGLTGPVMPIYLVSLGATPVMIGAMFGIAGIGEGIFAFIWGSSADRIGLRVPLLIQTLVGPLCLLVFAAVPLLLVLFPVRFVLSAVGAAFYPLGRGFLVNAVPANRKGTAMGLFFVLLSVGSSSGSAVSGVLVRTYGYAGVFAAAALVTFVAGLIVISELRNATIAHQPATDTPGVDPAVPARAALRPVFVLAAIASLAACASQASSIFLPLLMTEYGHISVEQVAFSYAFTGFVGLFLVLFTGGLSDRVSRKIVLLFGLALMIPGFAGLVFVRVFDPILLCMLGTSIGFLVTLPQIVTLLSNLTPPRYQGRSQGIFTFALNIGFTSGGVLMGSLWSVGGPALTYACAAILGVIAFLLTAFTVHEGKWQTNAAAARVTL